MQQTETDITQNPDWQPYIPVSHPSRIYITKRASIGMYFIFRGFNVTHLINEVTGRTAFLEVQNDNLTFSGTVHRNQYSDMNVFEI